MKPLNLSTLFIRFLSITFFFFLAGSVSSQELNCAVQVISREIQGVDRTVFEDMQKLIREFVNDRKWTKDEFKIDERIECSIMINLTKASGDVYEGTIQVQSRRPVYGTSFNTPLLNHKDEDFKINFRQFENLEFSETAHISNLTSILAFYAYMIIGLDYDSFSPNGGAPYFQKALSIVNNAQSSSQLGWKAFEGDVNRYWMVQNLLNKQFEGLRTCMYQYHRRGLDMMADKVEDARNNISEALEELRKVHRKNPNSFSMTLFFNAKADEIVNIYSEALPEEKAKIVSLLTEINPGNANKYQKILSGR